MADKDIDALAKAVINGDYGDGEERVEALGDDFKIVQNRVNELLDNDFRYDIGEPDVKPDTTDKPFDTSDVLNEGFTNDEELNARIEKATDGKYKEPELSLNTVLNGLGSNVTIQEPSNIYEAIVAKISLEALKNDYLNNHPELNETDISAINDWYSSLSKDLDTKIEAKGFDNDLINEKLDSSSIEVDGASKVEGVEASVDPDAKVSVDPNANASFDPNAKTYSIPGVSNLNANPANVEPPSCKYGEPAEPIGRKSNVPGASGLANIKSGSSPLGDHKDREPIVRKSNVPGNNKVNSYSGVSNSWTEAATPKLEPVVPKELKPLSDFKLSNTENQKETSTSVDPIGTNSANDVSSDFEPLKPKNDLNIPWTRLAGVESDGIDPTGLVASEVVQTIKETGIDEYIHSNTESAFKNASSNKDTSKEKTIWDKPNTFDVDSSALDAELKEKGLDSNSINARLSKDNENEYGDFFR